MTSSKIAQIKLTGQKASTENAQPSSSSIEHQTQRPNYASMKEQIKAIAHPLSLAELKSFYKMLNTIIN